MQTSLVRSLLFASTCAAGSIASAQVEPHRDIQLSIVDGQINTGVVDFDSPGNPVTPDVRVFSRPLGEGAIDHFTDDPGFNAFSGTFSPGRLIGFDILDHLRKWDPIEQHFDEIPDETLFINLGITSVTTPPASEPVAFPVPGFFFAAASGSGALHQHINFFLNTPQSPGVYLLQIQVVTNSSLIPSEAVYLVFHDAVEPAEAEAAAMYVETELLAPACPGDCDMSGEVEFNDLICSLFLFGTDDSNADCDHSGEVDFSDLICALFAFGTCE